MNDEGFALLDSMPIGAFSIAGDYTILYWNLCMEGWTDIRREEAVGRDLRDLLPRFRDPAISSRLATLFAGGPPVVLSYQLHGDLFPRKQATLVPRVRQCTASALPSKGGALFAVEDRTDIAAKSLQAQLEIGRREKVEQDLRLAIAEKETLMHELSHRIKNNLNMVLSFISLESSSLADGPARERMDALESRIHSIAALHNSLFRQKSGSDLPLDEYLASIAEHLFAAFSGTDSGARLELNLESLAIPQESVLYLGLCVNELLTNAIKYGGKHIDLAVASLPEGGLEVSVRDDGPGFTTPIPMREDSLGLRLVTTLAQQMGGTLEAEGSQGGLFRLRLPRQLARGHRAQ